MNTTQNYVNRLKSCGFSDANALRLVQDFLKNYYGEKELLEFIEQQEKDNFKDVGKVQCESNCGKCRRLCDTCDKCRIKCNMG